MKRTISTLLLVLLCLTPVSVRYWIQETYGAEICRDNDFCYEDIGYLARMNPAVLGGGGSAAANSCPTGTYMFAWNGDYPGDANIGCKTNGASTITGTQIGTVEINSDYGVSGNGIRITAVNESLKFDVTSDDIISKSVGTIWLSFYNVDITTNNPILEANSGTNANGVYLIQVANTFRGYFFGNSSSQYVASGSNISQDTWQRIAYSWDQPNGKHAVKIGAGAWVEETETLTAMSAELTELHLGEDVMGSSVNHAVYIDAVKVLSTYKADDPGAF